MADRLAVAQELDGGLALGIAPEVLVHRASLRDGIEGRILDGVTDLAAEDVVLPAVDLRPLHAARAHVFRDVSSKGVERFVVVIVGVEERSLVDRHAISSYGPVSL